VKPNGKYGNKQLQNHYVRKTIKMSMLKKVLKKNIIISTLLDVYHLLLPSQRFSALKVTVLIFIGSLVDVIGLASILPVMFMALDTTVIHTNVWINMVYTFLGFQSENSFIFCSVLALLFFYIVKNIISVLIIYFQSRFCYNIATNLSFRQFISYYSKDFLFFKNTNSNEIYRDIDMIPSGYAVSVMLPLLMLVSEGIVLAVIIITLSWIKAELFLLLILLLVPAFIVPYQLLKEKVHHLNESNTDLIPTHNKNILQTIFGFVDIKLTGREDNFINKYIKTKSKINTIQARLYTLDAIPVKLIELITILGIVIIFTYTVFWGNTKGELITLLSLFSAAAFRLMPSMSRILNSLMKIKGWKHSTPILRNIHNNEFNPFIIESLSEKMKFSNKILFENISFTFPDGNQFALKNITIEVKKGEAIGFVGKSGSGKSTLMNILLRFLKEQTGRISVDDKLLTDDNTRQWRNILGYVKQDIFIIDGTLLENIAYGVELEKIDFAKVEKALTMANLEEWVSNLPDGIQTNIGEFGSKISGGQKQRIGIARALYNEAEVLILDEATSQLDTQTEVEITESIENLSKNLITIFIIAHRLSTLKNCHRIYEMEKGEIICSHTFQEISNKF